MRAPSLPTRCLPAPFPPISCGGCKQTRSLSSPVLLTAGQAARVRLRAEILFLQIDARCAPASRFGWRSCWVREDWLCKACGVWSSEGAEVEAIVNVAESAHSAVATGWKIGSNPSRPCPGLPLQAEQVGQQHRARGVYRKEGEVHRECSVTATGRGLLFFWCLCWLAGREEEFLCSCCLINEK